MEQPTPPTKFNTYIQPSQQRPKSSLGTTREFRGSWAATEQLPARMFANRQSTVRSRGRSGGEIKECLGRQNQMSPAGQTTQSFAVRESMSLPPPLATISVLDAANQLTGFLKPERRGRRVVMCRAGRRGQGKRNPLAKKPASHVYSSGDVCTRNAKKQWTEKETSQSHTFLR